MENCILSANDRDIVELARSSLPLCSFFVVVLRIIILCSYAYISAVRWKSGKGEQRRRERISCENILVKVKTMDIYDIILECTIRICVESGESEEEEKITRNEIHTFEALLSLFALSARATRRDLDSAIRFRREKYVFVTTRGFVQIKYLPNVYTHRNDDDDDLP